MLLDASAVGLVPACDGIRARLSGELQTHTGPETNAAVLEFRSDVHSAAGGAVAQLAALREQLSGELGAMGFCAACAGTYPLASTEKIVLSTESRYRALADSLRSLARRAPTMALHVHVGIPDPEDAITLLNGLRRSLPLLLALSANSPFCEGRDGGFASERATIFRAFPRTGIPRRFAAYAEYVGAVDALIGTRAIPDPSFLWWDVRLQPALGTVEVRVMDAQLEVGDSAALLALVQSLARLELEGEPPAREPVPEVLAENCFLASRDGTDARLIDPAGRRLVPVRALVEAVVESCRPHAAALGCSVELERVGRLAAANGADRQRRWAREEGSLSGLLASLIERFCGHWPTARPVLAVPSSGLGWQAPLSL